MATSGARPKGRHFKRNVAVVVGILLGLSVAVVAIAGFVFGLSGSPGAPAPQSPVQVTLVSCSVRDNSCELVLLNRGSTSADAGGCVFNPILGPKGGNNNSIIVPGGPGVLSDKPGSLVNQTTSIAPGSSVTLYCTPTETPHSGTQVQGQVWWVREDWQYPSFSGTWN